LRAPGARQPQLQVRGRSVGPTSPCDVCGDRTHLIAHQVREMMFGWQERFDYLECGRCGYLRIAEVPQPLSRYYPDEYYAFQSQDDVNGIVRWLSRCRDRYVYRRRGIVGRLLAAVAGNAALESLAPLSLDRKARILDVGCGSGTLLHTLHDLGFTRLQGIDTRSDLEGAPPDDIVIRTADVGGVDGIWDLIMLHHVFEHLPDPRAALEHLHRCLDDAGTLLIRTPVARSQAWEEYGVDWVQLDAPRHLSVQSVDSLRMLAHQTGFIVDEIVFDSTAFQFWGSELYCRGIPLQAARGATFFKIFSLGQIQRWVRRARKLNATGLGDQASFYLKKAPRI